MSVETQVSASEVTISVRGRFDFNMHREFRQAYEQAGKNIVAPHYIIDLSGTDYMDSSALGMLLLLRDHAGGEGARISLVKCPPTIRNILEIANFSKMFHIDTQSNGGGSMAMSVNHENFDRR